MRTLFSTIFQSRYFSVCFFAALVFLASCKGDDGGGGGTTDDDPQLTAQQERAESLAGTWTSNEVAESPDDTEDAALQELGSLQMTFGVNQTTLAPTSFESSNAPTYFNSGSGATWAWADATTQSDINLSAVAPVSSFTITAFDGTTMTMSFDFEGSSDSRVEGVGTYRVLMTKQ